MDGGPSRNTHLDFLSHVANPLRKEVEQRIRILNAAKGRTLVERGSTSPDVFFLLAGMAEVVLYSSSGREVCVHNIASGEMFGEIAVLDGAPRSASVVALSELRLACMHGNDFLKCLESSPAAAIWLARRLASNLRRATERVFELSALDVPARIRCELLRLARQGEPRGSIIEVPQAPTHAELANRIGTHREAVTREMRVLTDMKIIRHGRRSLTIIDLGRLQQFANR